MNIIEVHRAKHLENGWIELNMTVILPGSETPEIIDFAYSPDDVEATTQVVGKWLEDNPDFEISPYVPVTNAVDPLTLPITKRQCILAMVKGLMMEDPDIEVEAAISAIDDFETRAVARADWRYSPGFWRNHPLFSDPSMLNQMGVTPSQVDDLWVLALEQPK